MSIGVKGRIPELDGVRGLAIAMILLHHYFLLPIHAPLGSLPSYIQAAGRLTWSGVDLFFVLSGFLIGGILLDARHASNYFRVFYTRRLLRIVPIYFLCLASVFFLAVSVDHGAAREFAWMFSERIALKLYPVFLQNFWMAKWTTFGTFGLGVSWSLAIEEQFYLTLPFAIRFLRSNTPLLTVLLGGIALAPISRILLHAYYPGHFLAWVVLMPCRADALLLGVLGAIAVRNQRSRDWLRRRRRLLFLSLGALTCALPIITKYFADPYGVAMLTVGFTYLGVLYLALILCAILYPDTLLARFLRWRWLGWLGTIAYGTYLYHELVRSLFFGLIWGHLPLGLSLPEFSVSLLALIATLLISQASWLYLEKPLVNVGHRVSYHQRTDRQEKVTMNEGPDVEKVAL